MIMTKPTTVETIRLADMGRQEAEEVTKLIKDNFDSLGAMLVQARDRKAYRALGYRSFESYCQSEFGKSVSSAYQLIEDAKVLSQLEAKISENYGEQLSLKFPASHLRPLKAVEDINDKLKAIEYAQKLAATQNRKATKKDLEIAVFQVSGKPSEDLKKAIEGLGLVKGTPVEVQNPLKKDRGVITRIDKSGKIYVELYYHSARAMPFNPEELRILSDDEKPANPLESSIASKGDRVLIFAAGMEGKKGTIFTWNESKETLVMVDGGKAPISIAYAEMELLQEESNSSWQVEYVWNSRKNTYYYLPQEDKIHSDLWPTTLSIEACTHSGTPTKFSTPAVFVEDWEEKYSQRILEGLATPERVTTLVLAQAIELPEEEGKKFAADLIASLSQLFPQTYTPNNTDAVTENQRLRTRLAEAEAAIQSMVNAASTVSIDTAANTDSLLENTPETSSPGEEAVRTDFLLGNTPETSGPGEVAVLPLSQDINPTTLDTTEEFFPAELTTTIAKVKAEKKRAIERMEHQLEAELPARESKKNLMSKLGRLKESLQYLEDVQKLRVGQLIKHKSHPQDLGKIVAFTLSQGGMPEVWVQWFLNEKFEEAIPEKVQFLLTKD